MLRRSSKSQNLGPDYFTIPLAGRSLPVNPRHGCRGCEYVIMQDYSIERVGQPDLVFNGELIGKSGGDMPRIRIYRTKASKYIAEIGTEAKRANAAHFDKPMDLVNWLKTRLNSITEEAQAAIEDASKNDNSFKNFWTERVE